MRRFEDVEKRNSTRWPRRAVVLVVIAAGRAGGLALRIDFDVDVGYQANTMVYAPGHYRFIES